MSDVINILYFFYRGHGIHLNDGREIGNIFQGNLLVWVRARSGLTIADLTPAAFWVRKRLLSIFTMDVCTYS